MKKREAKREGGTRRHMHMHIHMPPGGDAVCTKEGREGEEKSIRNAGADMVVFSVFILVRYVDVCACMHENERREDRQR